MLEAAPELQDEIERRGRRRASPARSRTGAARGGAWPGGRACPTAASPSQLVDGAQVLVCRAKGTVLSFRDGCARCGSGLERSVLDGDTLVYPAPTQRFDVRRAGRALEGTTSTCIRSFVVETGRARVALPEART